MESKHADFSIAAIATTFLIGLPTWMSRRLRGSGGHLHRSIRQITL